jgi:CO dehydrogenase/acetyl-CoA synthase beta subunit
MKKKSIIYSDLSKKQLEILKELYIQKRVESMSHQELKEYVLEIISHQINDTIGKEEEIEAWREMSDFFGEQFEIIILEIQKKYIADQNILEEEIDSHKQRIELLERNNLNQEKQDMWDD